MLKIDIIVLESKLRIQAGGNCRQTVFVVHATIEHLKSILSTGMLLYLSNVVVSYVLCHSHLILNLVGVTFDSWGHL
jgi:hypothetical protein